MNSLIQGMTDMTDMMDKTDMTDMTDETDETDETEISILKYRINKQDIELSMLHSKLIQSENKVKKLQDSEYILEEKLQKYKKN